MKILLPTDGSPVANEAVAFVQALAERTSVDVVVLMVSNVPEGHDKPQLMQEWAAQENERIQKILEQAQQTLQADCQSADILHSTGSVVPCILEHAQSTSADVIVMGAKGQTATLASQLGSVSDAIATQAKCSVCVVRPTRDGKHDLDKVLLAIDTSEASDAAVTEWMQLKLSRETQVTVVSVAQNPQIFTDDGCVSSSTPMPPEQITLIRDAAKSMAARVVEQYPKTDFQTLVADHVGEAIVEAAQNSESDMIIVGDVTTRHDGELFLGGTSKFVLRQAPCSVWISRYHWKSTPAQEAGKDVATVR